MNFTVGEIAALVGGKASGSQNKKITSIRPLESSDEFSVSYLENAELLSKIKELKAGCLLAPLREKEKIKLDLPVVWVENPKLAFAKLLGIEEKRTQKNYSPFVSPHAVVAQGADVDDSAYVGHFAVIEEGAVIGRNAVIEANCYVGKNSRIGENTRLYPGVVARENVFIGKNCIIHPNATLGGDGYGFVKNGAVYEKIPQIGSVKIGDGVEIGSNSAVDRATLGETEIGDGTKLDNLVHIAHNVKIGKNCLIVAQVGIAGSCVIGDNVIISGQAGVADHVKIGDNSVIVARTGVIGPVKPGSVLFGYLARPRNEYMKIEAILSKLPDIYDFYKKAKKHPAFQENEKKND